MDYVRTNKIDLKALFRKYCPDAAHAGEMDIDVFVSLTKSIGLNWPNEDYECMADLLDGEHKDGRIHLSSLTAFGKSAMDNFIVTVSVIVYMLYPTITTLVC